jgi:hypothetical protein
MATSNYIWYTWNTQYTTDTATTTWSNWNQEYETTGGSSTTTSITVDSTSASFYELTWHNWNIEYENEVVYEPPVVHEPPVNIQEERQRAKQLLEEHLTKEQKNDLASKNEFEVESQSGKRYAIQLGVAGNVFKLNRDKKKITKYCIHPTDNVVDYDAMLSQLIWLKWNEQEFEKVANKTPLAA